MMGNVFLRIVLSKVVRLLDIGDDRALGKGALGTARLCRRLRRRSK